MKMNKYLLKISSSDLAIATQSKKEEDKAIGDYTDRLKEAKSPALKDAINHARKEEEDHSKSFGKVLEKLSSMTKEALNAFKAREMAKKVGIIADPSSAWKYAVRHLRKGTGEVLQGEQLSQAKIKLGDLSKGAYNKTKSMDKSDGVEYAGQVSHSGDLVGELKAGTKTGTTLTGSQNLHTHPGITGPEIKYTNDVRDFNKARHSLAGPSGMNPHTTRAAYKLESGARTRISEINTKTKVLEKSMKAGTLPAKETFKRINKLYRAKSINLKNSILTNDLNTNVGKLQHISAPSVDATSSYKVTKNGPRVVYFDHTPKKI